MGFRLRFNRSIFLIVLSEYLSEPWWAFFLAWALRLPSRSFSRRLLQPRQSPPSSCWPESITAQCMAAQRPPFLLISLVRRRRSSPVWTATPWRAKDGQVRLWGFPRSDLSSPGLWVSLFLLVLLRPSPKWP